MADEPTAIRHPKRRSASHLLVKNGCTVTVTCGAQMHHFETVPADEVPASERCRTCWPTTKGEA